MVGIVFMPAGLSSLLGLPMYEFTDERINLTDVLGGSVQNLHEQILEAEDADRITHLDINWDHGCFCKQLGA